MKNKTVHDIFKKSPEKDSGYKYQDDFQAIESKMYGCIIREVNYKRKVQSPYYQWMRFCEVFKVFVLKKLCFTLIMNFIEFHITKFLYTKLEKPGICQSS